MKKEKILFICTHNSARSQMAEGFINSRHNEKYEAFSAGTTPTKVNPYAITAMSEIGIDISKHYSKNVNEFPGKKFDYVVTVCDNAKETCPFFPGGAKYIHQSFNDPSQCKGIEEEIMNCVRNARDEIGLWVEKTFGSLNK
jgi:arsenate reductase